MKECPNCERCFSDDVNFCPHDQTQIRVSLPGDKLLANRYLLEKRIGRGAMGQVYLARDQNLGTRRVAVKTVRQDILSSEDLQEGEAIARFEREAMSAASISHPHVVDVTNFGKTSDGVFFLVMEYVEGETLHRLLRREGTLQVKRAVKLLCQIAEGVEAAHDAGILHRDLKPANIFIMHKGKTDEDGFVKVGDFGLAKIINQTVTDISSNAAPSSRGVIGTPEFMAPEQMQSELGVDARADIYALGTIAYLMLGGRTPFAGDLMQLVMQKMMNDPPPLSTLRNDLPKDFEFAIMNALQIDPKKRPASVTEWIANLEAAAEDVKDKSNLGTSRLVILAPVNAEVYVNDERKGSVGSSGRLVLSTVPAGQHVLRVSKPGEKDDERVIEVREGADEQVIQAHLKLFRENRSLPTTSQSGIGSHLQSSVMPGIVACTSCGARFAEGVKFCGRCGNRNFTPVSETLDKLMFQCPRCSTNLLRNTKFCGRCGLSIKQISNASPKVSFSNPIDMAPLEINPNEKNCGNCGLKSPLNVMFCGRCGKNIS